MQIDVGSRERVVERRKPLLVGEVSGVTPLRVATLGLVDTEVRSLRTMLAVAEPRVRLPIRVVELAEAQLVFVARRVLRDSRANSQLSGRAIVVYRQEDDPPARADDVVITAPMRLMPLMDGLNHWAERLGLRAAVAPAPVMAHDDTPGHTGTLAHALMRIFDQAAPHDAHVRAIGFGELSVLMHRGRYRSDVPTARLREAMASRRFVITGNCDAAKRLPDEELRPLRELRWVAALEGAHVDRHGLPARFRLTRWPDFGSLPHDVAHLKLSVLLSGRVLELPQACTMSAMAPEQVVPFLVACRDCGYLVAADATAPTSPVVPVKTGLFDRLLRRFGF